LLAVVENTVPAALECGTVIHTDELLSGGTTPCANAVVATCVVAVLAAAVGAVGVPVNPGEASGAPAGVSSDALTA
jgi:hypothetical protein